MPASPAQRARMIAANQREYGERYQDLHFPDSSALAAAEQQRSAYLDSLAATVVSGCADTKLDMHRLSPGCRICTEGGWSCLFISGKCNCRCFYCPTAQDEEGEPTTNSVSFASPEEYVAYLERFGFTGASISGGEPLLNAARSLAYVKAIKQRFGSGIHVWLYTNGTLATDTVLGHLQDAGLDEIRFDIGATNYSLEPLQRAVGRIPTVTVEVPAIPEERERLQGMLKQMSDVGVQHFNLHQLRLTPFNFPQLQGRGYRFLHGERVTVLDSELTALALLQHRADTGIDLPINYCSFPYKNRFQGKAARQRNASQLIKEYEALTSSGFIRTLTLLGEPARLEEIVDRCCRLGGQQGQWVLNGAKDRLLLHPELWLQVKPTALRLVVCHSAVYQRSALSYQNPFATIQLTPTKKIVFERQTHHADIELEPAQAELFAQVFLLNTESPASLPQQEIWEQLLAFEHTPTGLVEYF